MSDSGNLAVSVRLCVHVVPGLDEQRREELFAGGVESSIARSQRCGCLHPWPGVSGGAVYNVSKPPLHDRRVTYPRGPQIVFELSFGRPE